MKYCGGQYFIISDIEREQRLMLLEDRNRQ